MKKLIVFLMILMLAIPVKAGTLTKKGGVNYFDGHKETYYNLPMDRVLDRADKDFGSHHKRWIRDDGVKMYGTMIIVAGAKDRYGEFIKTSLGDAIILDCGAFAIDNPEQIDIAVAW